MAKHVTITQIQTLMDGMAAKNDLRFRKLSDKIAKTDLATALSDEIDAKAEASNLSTVSGKVDTLVGADSSKSVRTIANEELAAQLIPANAKEALDTLQEIAAWIQDHPDEAAAINAKLTLGTHEVDGSQVQYATVKAYVEAYVASQISDASLSGSNAIDISNDTVSLIVDTANANGISVGANGIQLALATGTTAGAMSAADKAKLDAADVTAYTSGNGIDITSHAVSVAVDANNANGLSAGANGLAMAAATPSVSGVGGTNGALTAADKEKLDNLQYATDSEITAIIDGLYAEPGSGE